MPWLKKKDAMCDPTRTTGGPRARIGVLSNRLIRLRALEIRRSASDQARTVRDAVVLTAAVLIALLLLVAVWRKLWSLSSNPAYLAVALCTAPIGFATVRSLRWHRSWVREHGILSEDALRRDRWTVYRTMFHMAAGLSAWLPVMILAAHLGRLPFLSVAIGALATVAAGAAALVYSRPIRSSPPSETVPGRVGSHASGRRRIAMLRRLSPLPARVRRWSSLVAAGLAAGLLPGIAAAVGAGSEALFLCASATIVLPLLWLTRQDGDLTAAQALAGVPPMAGAIDALAPAGAYGTAVAGGLLASAILTSAPYALVGIAGSSLAALSVVYVLRAWRMRRLPRRTADVLASVDLAIVALVAATLSWAALPALLLLVWRLHRRTRASLMIL